MAYVKHAHMSDFIFIFAIRMCRMQFHPHRIFMIRFMCPLCVYLSLMLALETNAMLVIKVCAHKKSINCINMTTFACSVSYSLPSLLLSYAMRCVFFVGSSSHLSCHALVPACKFACFFLYVHWHRTPSLNIEK